MNSPANTSIAVLITCHNRREATVRCLRSLAAAASSAGIRDDVRVILVDDASTDGTAAAAAGEWPGVTVVDGSGELFWAGGMALAERVAGSEVPDAGFLLWLNDDVELEANALELMLGVAGECPGAIVVGALRGSDGSLSYSGIRLTSGRHPLRYERVAPGAKSVKVDTLNGNLVLVPVKAAAAIGGIDEGFRHAFADFDYGVRAGQAGVEVVLAPGPIGLCDRNPPPVDSPTIAGRWRSLFAPTGGALGDSARYLRRHGPVVAIAWIAVPLLRFVAGELARLPLIGRLVPRRALPGSRR